MNRVGFVAVAVSLASSCAQPPTREVEMASARVEAAKSEDAAVFAPELLAEAEDALLEAKRGLEEPSRYGVSLRAAATASIRADEALHYSRAERIVVARRLDQLLYELESLVAMSEKSAAGRSAQEKLALLRARFEAIRKLAESGNVLAAHHDGSMLKPELVELERSLRP